MKGIILAAGIGSRLNSNTPKPLNKITKEKTIMDFQISSLSKKIGKSNILVVVGYMKEQIVEKFPDLHYIFNKEFKTTNTSKSLLLALKQVNDDDVIWMNGDVCFDEEVLDLIIDQKYSCCLVNNSICNEEEVKYSLDNKGFIEKLSKSINSPKGEALGINLITKKDLEYFRSDLEKVNDNDYFEKSLENIIKTHQIKLLPINVGNFFCKEIDFKSDLEDVRNYFIGRV